MKDMLISLGYTGLVTPFLTAYIMGWSWTKSVLVQLFTLLAIARWSVERFFNYASEDASDW